MHLSPVPPQSAYPSPDTGTTEWRNGEQNHGELRSEFGIYMYNRTSLPMVILAMASIPGGLREVCVCVHVCVCVCV